MFINHSAYSKLELLLASIIVLALSCSVQAAPVTDAQCTEAQSVFERLLEQTDNPLVAQLARESLQRIQAKQEGKALTGQKTAQPARDLRATVAKSIEIPISKLNDHPMVPVYLDGQVMANFLIDTGSTYTVISPELAQLLDAHYEVTGQRATLLTGNGVVKAPIVVISSMRIGPYKVAHVKAIIHSLGNQPYFSGLLGLNVFKDKEMTYKADRIVLTSPSPSSL